MNNTTVVDLSFDSFSNSTNILNSDLGLNNITSESGDRLLFIDSAVEDYQSLINNLVEPTEVIVLDPQKDGISQISQTLDRYDSLDEIHIVSHGNNGELFLGNTTLDRDSLIDYQEELNSWGDSLEEHGDILLYGCNVAADLAGAEFVKDLSEYTNADIQASNDLTGNSELGGDWDLEYAIGEIEAESIFNDEIQSSYLNTFFTFTGDVINHNFDFNISDIISSDNFIDGFNNNNNNNTIPEISLPPSISDIAFQYNDLFQIDNNTLGININSSGYNPNTNYQNITSTNNPDTNAILFGFTIETLDFNHTTFDFNSITTNGNNISFGLRDFLDISTITNNNSLKFNFLDVNDVADNSFTEDSINIGSILSFDAENVTFTNSSISFEYEPNSLNFDPAPFVENANLFDYKFSDIENFSFTESNLTFDNFNSSDYRALEYAFTGDELFDPEYYLDHDATPIGTNPFTDYIENGWKLGLDPHPLFDVDYYLNNNTDIKNAGEEPLSHYVTIGYTEDHENRDPNALFDTSYYNANNSDVVQAGAIPLLHYATTGDGEYHENRDPNRFFDSSYYNLNNPDVVADEMTALEHWMRFGYAESRPENPNYNPHRNPHPFLNATDYYVLNDDVRIASYELPSANPVQHLMEFGLVENRITHQAFRGEKVIRIASRITPNDGNIDQYQELLEANNIRVEITDNNTFEISHFGITDHQGNFSPFHSIGEVAVITFTVLAGATTKIVEYTAEGINDVIDYVNSLDFSEAPTFGGYTYGHAIGFGYEHQVVPGSEAFETVVFDELPSRTIEVFDPEDLLDDNSIFTTPTGNLAEDVGGIPLVYKTPLRDEFLRNLLNDGVFLGGQEAPQGIYFLSSSSDNIYYGYDPFKISNADDWEQTIQQNGTKTITYPGTNVTAVLPDRVPNTVRRQQRQQGITVNNDPTHGLLYTTDSNSIRLRSGSNSTSQAYRESLFVRDGVVPSYIDETLEHVEGNAATIMRERDIPGAVLYINHELGPCPSCDGIPGVQPSAVEQILKQGQRLTVFYKELTGQTKFKIYNGKASQ